MMRNANSIAAMVELTEVHRLVNRAGQSDCYSAPQMVVNAACALGLARQYVLEERQKAWKDARMKDYNRFAKAFDSLAKARRELAHMVYDIRYKKRDQAAKCVLRAIAECRDILMKEEGSK